MIKCRYANPSRLAVVDEEEDVMEQVANNKRNIKQRSAWARWSQGTLTFFYVHFWEES